MSTTKSSTNEYGSSDHKDKDDKDDDINKYINIPRKRKRKITELSDNNENHNKNNNNKNDKYEPRTKRQRMCNDYNDSKYKEIYNILKEIGDSDWKIYTLKILKMKMFEMMMQNI